MPLMKVFVQVSCQYTLVIIVCRYTKNLQYFFLCLFLVCFSKDYLITVLFFDLGNSLG